MFWLLTALQDVLAEECKLDRPVQPTLSVETRVRLIQAEQDEDLRNQVISDCLPYIKGVVRRMVPVSNLEQSDEFSIALSAFNSAIDRYDASTNVPFLRFAGLVVNRKIIDWIRKQRHSTEELTFSQVEADHGDTLIDKLGSVPGSRIWENMEIEEEIMLLKSRMANYGLTIKELAQMFPKHRDSRLMCISLARHLLATPELIEKFELKNRLPATDLSRSSGVPVKTIERNRQSIIFVALLLSSDLEVIKSYLSSYSKEAPQ